MMGWENMCNYGMIVFKQMIHNREYETIKLVEKLCKQNNTPQQI